MAKPESLVPPFLTLLSQGSLGISSLVGAWVQVKGQNDLSLTAPFLSLSEQ